jgi:hypothetical protein
MHYRAAACALYLVLIAETLEPDCLLHSVFDLYSEQRAIFESILLGICSLGCKQTVQRTYQILLKRASVYNSPPVFDAESLTVYQRSHIKSKRKDPT